MAWPQSQDYNEAIQNAKSCFKDPELSKGQAVTNAMGMPLPCSGNFADVYQVNCHETKTRWAVKCFTRGDPTSLAQRYAKIDEHLQQAKLPFAVGFRYLEEGIRIRNQWHPVLKMQWVEGFTLNHFVRDNLDKPNLLEALLQIWVRMAKRLRESDMAHADLQHGNVLLVPGSTANALGVKLIDYDGMWVPALAGKKSGEVGHPAYQHTKRLYEGTYSKEVDRFPLLVVAASLRCLRVAGRPLWEKFDNGDNLLFREADLAAPDRSPLFAELEKVQDAQAKLLVEAVRVGCDRPLEEAPFLDELLADALPGKKPTPTAITRSSPAAATAPQPADAFADLGSEEPARERPARKSRQRDADLDAALPWKKWAIIGGGAGAALLALILVIALSGSGKDKPEKPGDGQATTDDRGDTKNPDKDSNTKKGNKPPDPLPPRLAFQALSELRLVAGGSRRFYVQVSGVNSTPGFKTEFSGLPEGVTAELIGTDTPEGKCEWIITARADVSAADYQLTIAASAGTSRTQANVRLKVEAAAVVVPPDPAAGGKGKLAGTLTTDDLVQGVSFSPDGQKGLGYTKNHIYFLDPATGKQIGSRIAAPDPPIHGAAWMPDSRRYLLASKGPLVIVDPDTRKADIAINRTVANVTSLALSADARWAAGVAEGPDLQLFDLANKKVLHTLKGCAPGNRQMAFSRDGSRLLIASPPPHARRALINVQTGEEVFRLDGTTPNPNLLSVAITPDSKRAVLGFAAGLVQLWDLENNKGASPRGKEPAGHTAPVQSCAYSADGRHVLSGAQDGAVRLWEAETGKEVRRLEGHTGPVADVALSLDGRRALTTSANVVQCWELGLGGAPLPTELAKAESRLLDDPKGVCHTVAFSPDGRTIQGHHGTKMFAWDAETGKFTYDATHQKNFPICCFLPDGNRAVVTVTDHTLQVLDLQLSQLHLLGKHASYIRAMAVSRDGKRAVSVSGERVFQDGQLVMKDGIDVWKDLTLCVWNIETRTLLREVNDLPIIIDKIAISGDGKRALAYGNVKRQPVLSLWDLETGREVRRPDMQGQPFIMGMGFAPDGKSAAVFQGDRRLRILNVDSDRDIQRMGPMEEQVHALVFSADGNSLLSGGGLPRAKNEFVNCTARLWDVTSGRELARMEGHTQPILALALSPDGRRVASTSQDKTVRLWDLKWESGKPVPPPMPDPPEVTERKKTAPPDEPQHKAALDAIKDLYKAEYAKTKPMDRAALAGLLFGKAQEVKDNPTDRFVLLKESAELSAALGNVKQALAALDMLDEQYDFDAIELKLNALTAAGKLTIAPAGQKALAEATLPVLDEARARENIEAMTRLAVLAETGANRSQDPPFRTKFLALVKELREGVKEAEPARLAETALKTDPNDAGASALRGKFLCFRLGAWQRGLPLLAKGNDPVLKELAAGDLAAPAAPEECAKLGDGWNDIAKNRPELGKIETLRRAALWYNQALTAGLTGINKSRVEKLLKTAEDQLPQTRTVQTAGELRKISGHKSAVTNAVYLADGVRVLSYSDDGLVRLCDAASGKELRNFRIHTMAGGKTLAASPNGDSFVAGSAGLFYWWEFTGRNPRAQTGYGGNATASVAYIPKTRKAALIGSQGIRVLSDNGADSTLVGKTTDGPMLAFAVCAGGGGMALAGTEKGSLLMYSLNKNEGQEAERIGSHMGPVVSVALSSDGLKAVSSGEDKTLRLWDVKQAKELRRFAGHSGAITCVVLSADGRLAATSGEDGTIRVWDTATGQETRRFLGHKGKVTSVSFSPDGRRLVSSGEDMTVRIWGR